MPTTAANATSTIRIPPTRTCLSWLPARAITKSLTGTGVRLMATWPTATTGPPSGPISPATSWATPSAAAAASSPDTAPSSARPSAGRVMASLSFALITDRIRGYGHHGLADPEVNPGAPATNPPRAGRRIAGMNGRDVRAVRAGTGPLEGTDQDLDELLGLVARGDQAAFEAV